jgi:hypothetical protein
MYHTRVWMRLIFPAIGLSWPATVAVTSQRVGSYVLLAAGVLLVFAGLASALAFSPSGLIASAAAIAALLYAGAVWFGGSPRADASLVLFTPQLTVAAGPFAGRAVSDLFPIPLRTEIDAQCRAALEGRACRFSPADGQTFDAAAVRSADGLVVYGILIANAATPERAAAG